MDSGERARREVASFGFVDGAAGCSMVVGAAGVVSAVTGADGCSIVVGAAAVVTAAGTGAVSTASAAAPGVVGFTIFAGAASDWLPWDAVRPSIRIGAAETACGRGCDTCRGAAVCSSGTRVAAPLFIGITSGLIGSEGTLDEAAKGVGSVGLA